MHLLKVASPGVLSCCIALMALSRPANADVMAYEFAGVVDWVGQMGSGWVLDNSITVGTPFAGRFSFNPATPDSDPAPDRARYRGSGFSMAVEIGSYSWASGDGGARAEVGLGGFWFSAEGFAVGDGLWGNSLTCSLALPGLSGGPLPTEPFPLSSTSLVGKIDNVPFTGGSHFGGHLTEFSIVPEPTGVLLLALGVVFLRRRANLRIF